MHASRADRGGPKGEGKGAIAEKRSAGVVDLPGSNRAIGEAREKATHYFSPQGSAGNEGRREKQERLILFLTGLLQKSLGVDSGDWEISARKCSSL